MSTLFISHSSRDQAAASLLQQRLAVQGHHSVFLDFDPAAGIQAGVSWERTLYTKLRACRAVVALCSDHYLASQWCFAEVALARMEGKQIFVLKIDPFGNATRLPSILESEQTIDLRTLPEQGWQRLWLGFKHAGIVSTAERDWDREQSPYPGLRAFNERDAAIFFGRDSEIREGTELLHRVRRLGHPRVVMVLGASGSGKSSLAMAGLLPELRREPRQWRVLRPFRPGQQPLRELAGALSQAFDEAGSPLALEEILRQLDGPLEGAGPVGQPGQLGPDRRVAAGAVVGATPQAVASTEPGGQAVTRGALATSATARQKLLQALSAMAGELSAADAQVAGLLQPLLAALARPEAQQPDSAVAPLGASRGPAELPLVSLAHRLRLQGPEADASVVLVIDQFEELLGQPEGHPAQRFLHMLRAVLDAADSPLLLLATLRSDFLDGFQRCAALQGLGFKSLSVGPVSAAGMRQLIEEPARLGQISLEPGLADELLADTNTPDALPLLAFTLQLMWQRFRVDRLLEIREYRELGGLQGAIAQVAEDTYQAALAQGDEARQGKGSQPGPPASSTAHATLTTTPCARAIRDAFLGLARPAADGVGWSRQPMAWDRLDPGVQALLARFIDPQRLLVKRGDGTVEVAHEALFRSWQTLKDWLADNASGLRLLREIHEQALRWQAVGDRAVKVKVNRAGDRAGDPVGQKASLGTIDLPSHRSMDQPIDRPSQAARIEAEREPYLFRGARLTQALELQGAGVLQLQDLERRFIEASATAEQAKADARERRRKQALHRLQVFAAVLGACLLLALWFWREADTQRSAAERQRKMGLALAHAKDALLGRLILREVPGQPPGWTALAADQVLFRVPQIHATGPDTLDSSVVALAAGPAGRFAVATTSHEVWLGERRLAAADGATNAVNANAAESASTANSAETPAPRRLGTHGAKLWDVAFSQSGQIVASADNDGVVKIWSTAAATPSSSSVATLREPTGTPIAAPTLTPTRTPDPAPLHTLQPSADAPGQALRVRLSRDGQVAAVLAEDGEGGARSISVWWLDGAVPRRARLPPRGEDDAQTALAVSPGGGQLLVGYTSGAVVLWSLRPELKPLERLATPRANSPVRQLSFGDNDQEMAGADEEGRVWWRLAPASTAKDVQKGRRSRKVAKTEGREKSARSDEGEKRVSGVSGVRGSGRASAEPAERADVLDGDDGAPNPVALRLTQGRLMVATQNTVRIRQLRLPVTAQQDPAHGYFPEFFNLDILDADFDGQRVLTALDGRDGISSWPIALAAEPLQLALADGGLARGTGAAGAAGERTGAADCASDNEAVAAAYLPDKRVLAAYAQGSLRLWSSLEPVHGRRSGAPQVQTLWPGPCAGANPSPTASSPSRLTTLAASSDGRRVATAFANGRIAIGALGPNGTAAGPPTMVTPPGLATVRAGAGATASRVAVSAAPGSSTSQTCQPVEARGGSSGSSSGNGAVPAVSPQAVWSLAWSPDGGSLLAGLQDGRVMLLAPDTGAWSEVAAPGARHTGAVCQVGWAPGNDQLLSASLDKQVKVWALAQGRPTGSATTLQHASAVYSAAFDASGRQVVTGAADFQLLVWRLGPSGPTQQAQRGHVNAVRGVAFGEQGRWVLSGAANQLGLNCLGPPAPGAVTPCDAERLIKVNTPHQSAVDGAVRALAIAPAQPQFAVVDASGGLNLFRTDHRQAMWVQQPQCLSKPQRQRALYETAAQAEAGEQHCRATVEACQRSPQECRQALGEARLQR